MNDVRDKIILEFGRDPLLAHRTLFRHRHPEPTKPFHDEIIKDWHSDHPRVLTMIFRGGAKSTVAEEAIAMMAAHQQFHNGLVIGETEPRAQERLAAIKNELETNEEILQLYGDLRGKKWQETYIELSNGIVLHAYGRGQSLRGTKHLHYRPDIAFLDDLEDEESVKTPETRLKTMDWYVKTFLPALAPRARIRVAATPLHPEALAMKLAQSKEWLVRKYPLLIIDEEGREVSIWPERYPTKWCTDKRTEYASLGQMQAWQQEFMCEAENPSDKIFTSNMFRYEPLIRTWQPVYVVYDPARTTKATSSMTGKVVGSWINNRLVIWEASGHFWKPDEILEDIFAMDTKYNPVNIGVEEDGLHEFIMQPLRHAQMQRGHPVPVKPLKAPKGKDDFISSLQPFFRAGEVIFAGPREAFKDLETQLLSFTPGRAIGRKDVPNALAYFLKLRPGTPIHDCFNIHNIEEDIQALPRTPFYLCVNATNALTTAILCQFQNGTLNILTDYVRDDSPIATLGDIVREAGIHARARLTLVAPPDRFDKYDTTGLVQTARRIPITIERGVPEVRGREELRLMMQRQAHGRPAFRVSTEATWTLRGLSGGYARDVGKDDATLGLYKTLCEGLESFVGTLSSGLRRTEDDSIRYSMTRDGRRYISSRKEL